MKTWQSLIQIKQIKHWFFTASTPQHVAYIHCKQAINHQYYIYYVILHDNIKSISKNTLLQLNAFMQKNNCNMSLVFMY